jgi:hypothetical protein
MILLRADFGAVAVPGRLPLGGQPATGLPATANCPPQAGFFRAIGNYPPSRDRASRFLLGLMGPVRIEAVVPMQDERR